MSNRCPYCPLKIFIGSCAIPLSSLLGAACPQTPRGQMGKEITINKALSIDLSAIA